MEKGIVKEKLTTLYPRPLWSRYRSVSPNLQPLRSRLKFLLYRSAKVSVTSMIALYVVVISLFVSTSTAFSQQVTVNAAVDSQTVVIGDWIKYSVEVKHPSSVNVTLPVFKDTIGLFDVVEQDTIFRREENGTVQLNKKFVIAKYDAGNYYIPPYTVHFTNSQGKTESAQSNAIYVQIRGVEVDTSQTIKDVKPPLTVPMSAEEIAAYVGILAAVGGLAYALYYYAKKRKRSGGTVGEEKRPNIPPHVLALMQLEALEAKRLWQAGEIKAYYSEATEIVRRYFEQRYGIMALEMTTGEVMLQLAQFKLQQSIVASIESMLTGADLVKFAKYQPVAAENEQVIAQARSIVEQTMPEKVVPSVPKVSAQETIVT